MSRRRPGRIGRLGRLAALMGTVVAGAAASSAAAAAQVPALSREGAQLRRIEEPTIRAPGSLPTEQDLLRRIDFLLPVLDQARAAESAARERQRLEEARLPAVTELVRVGPLHVLAPPDQAELAADLFGATWREHFEWASGSPSLAEHVFVFQWRWRSAEPLRIDPAATGHAGLQRVELTRAWARTRAAAQARVREAIWSVLRTDLPAGSPMAAWIGSNAYPVTERVSRRVITTASEPGRACVGGRTDACHVALGLAGDERTLPPEAPGMVLLEAVRLGGEGAWERLVERGDAAPVEALEHVAGADLESVITAWQSSVLAARPEVHAGLGWQAVRTLIWVLALMAFAMRSTRWRLG